MELATHLGHITNSLGLYTLMSKENLSHRAESVAPQSVDQSRLKEYRGSLFTPRVAKSIPLTTRSDDLSRRYRIWNR